MRTTGTYKAGDRIEYRTFSGEIRQGTVIRRVRDIKGGRPGFDIAIGRDGFGSHWGYDSQITRVMIPGRPKAKKPMRIVIRPKVPVAKLIRVIS
jgi:hypothetical protein